MLFEVDLLADDPISNYSWGSPPSDLRVEHKFHSGGRMGGPYVAEAEVTGPLNALIDCFLWLRRPVNVYNDQSLLVWWGFVREVRLETSGIAVSLSLDKMANKVKVIYTYKSGVTYLTGETDWAGDAISQDRYGIKEYVHTLGEGESVGALAARATALAALKKPNSQYSSRGSSTQPTVTLLFSGWFETLGWRLFNRDEGRIEYEPTTAKRVQLLGWQYAGTDVSFEVTGSSPDFTYKIKATTPVFENYQAGAKVLVAGSVANNGTFTVVNAADSGNSLQVEEAVTNAAAGPSVTVTSVGYETAQKFTATSTFVVDRISADIAKIGNPSGDVTFAIRADSSGSPGSDLVSASLAASEVAADNPQELWITMPRTLTITEGSDYWVCVRKVGGLSSTDYYVVRMFEDAYAVAKGYNGSSWTTLVETVAFKVWGSEDNAVQMQRIVSDCGQFFRRLEIESNTLIYTNQYRDGYKTAYDTLIKLLEQGTSTGKRLIAFVTPDRVLQIRVQPDFTDDADIVTLDGRIRRTGGSLRDTGDLPYCQWLSLEGFPAQVSSLLQISPFFVDEARWDSGRPEIFGVTRAVDEYKVG